MEIKKTWLEHVRAGEPYQMLDWDFIHASMAGKAKAAAYNAEPDFLKRQEMLKDMLGKVGKDVVILPNITIDLGFLIEVGDETFINSNCTFLDTYPIHIGSNVQIGPNCGFYPVGHPLDARRRNFPDPVTGERRSITQGAPIVIEDNVWFGGHVVVTPGVTVGARSTIGAGSVVTRSIPPDVFAAGNPARVIKEIR